MEIKTSDLTGLALCYAACMTQMPHLVWGKTIGLHHASPQIVVPELREPKCYTPFIDWETFGPLMSQEGIRWNKDADEYYAWIGGHDYIDPLHEPMMDGFTPIEWDAFEYGPTLLIAIVRCYIAYKMGETMEIPDELVATEQETAKPDGQRA